jgi:hypothetical protein
MADPEFPSLHLASDQARLAAFREARNTLREACGDATLAGTPEFLTEGESGGGATLVGNVTPPADSTANYHLQMGDTRYPLALGVNSVGRQVGNAVVLEGPHISRTHCAIVIHSDGRVELYDIASKNGTLLNGRPLVGHTPLKPGDKLSIAGQVLIFDQTDPTDFAV